MPNQPAQPVPSSDMDPNAEVPMPGHVPAEHDGREQEDSERQPGQHHDPIPGM